MNKTLKEKWVNALRSGKYKQGKGRLRTCVEATVDEPNPDWKYCCLGVLCDLMEGGKWNKAAFKYKNHSDHVVLPASLGLEIGLHPSPDLPIRELRENGLLTEEEIKELQYATSPTGYGMKIPLTVINDQGFPFDRIATIIEQLIPTDD